jgi:hypothetical protein
VIRIGITGHRDLPPQTTASVDRAIRTQLIAEARNDALVGVTCLADGADQIFAQAVMDCGDSLEVVVPSSGYRESLPTDCWPTYDALFAKAQAVHRMPHERSDATAHMAASRQLLEMSDQLFAVWDGEAARGYGGTADVVTLARSMRIPVVILWPDDATRD